MTGHVLVTGAAGFIGRRVVSALADRGRAVVATDVAAPRDGASPFHVADVRDAARLAPLVAAADAVVHCGGISGPMVAADHPAEVVDINVRGTTQLLAMAQAFGVRRVVALSSVSAYGSTPPGLDPVDEDAPLSASTFYGTSKAAGDLVAQTFHAHGLDVLALRAGWVYGPGRVTASLIQPIVRSATGPRYDLPSGADHMLQFVHIDDAVAAILAALDAAAPSRCTYNVNGAETVRVGDLFAAIAAQRPDVRASVGPGLLNETDVQGRMDLTAAARDLGWAPQVRFADGLRAYVDWLGAHPV